MVLVKWLFEIDKCAFQQVNDTISNGLKFPFLIGIGFSSELKMSIDRSSAHYQLILADTEAIKSTCSADKNCPFRGTVLLQYVESFQS